MKACEIDLDLCQFLTKKMREDDVQAVYDSIEAGVKMKGFLFTHAMVTDDLEEW